MSPRRILPALVVLFLSVAPRPAAAQHRRAHDLSASSVTRAAWSGDAARDSAAMFSSIESELLVELNRARTDPRGYARALDSMVPWFSGNDMRRPGSNFVLRTHEGASAVREAIAVLKKLQPLPPLVRSAGLSLAARDHVRDQGPPGRMGHVGSDGSHMTDRANRYGEWDVTITENIAYGPLDARGMVIGLIVDDGVADRGHRENIYDPRVQLAGIACGPHKVFGRMCVIDHAAQYREKVAAKH